MRFGELVIFVFMLIFSVFFAKKFILDNGSDKVIIESRDKSLRYDLNRDEEIVIGGLLGDSEIIIRNGEVKFLNSPCRDKLCVKAGILRNAPLICMPNGVIIRFENDSYDGLEIDSVAQ